jgi:hypothetical protein
MFVFAALPIESVLVFKMQYCLMSESYTDFLLEFEEIANVNHSMTRPHVPDRNRSPDTKGSCEYTEQAVADSRRGVVLQSGS